ncbi:MAG: sulfatase-like hydrolase/transferase, partial [Thermoplasmata archaeon]|nr:sulfatase-like hydrolase/transferase [Thermoplasmata archaeon]
MDCVRARDFPGGPEPVTGMPTVEALAKESVQFPRAVSPAPWTIPSHASLFTGLYPWEHGVTMVGEVALR